MTSITKELRQWAKDQFFRKYEPAKSVSYLHAINDFADHIDAELTERYIELPVDVDGMPIHVDDVMVYSETNLCPKRVMAIISSAIFLTDDGPRFANMCRHQPDTWESIIRDILTAGAASGCIDINPYIARCEALASEKEMS